MANAVGEQISKKLSSFIDSLFTPLGGDDADWSNGSLARPPHSAAANSGFAGAQPPHAAGPVSTPPLGAGPSLAPPLGAQPPPAGGQSLLAESHEKPRGWMSALQRAQSRSAARHEEADPAFGATMGEPAALSPPVASGDMDMMDVNDVRGAHAAPVSVSSTLGVSSAGAHAASGSTSSPQGRLHSPQPRQQQRPRAGSTQKRNDPPVQQSASSAGVAENSESSASRKYTADADDLLDQHVAYYFRHHPEVYKRHRISRKRPGIYELDGREIEVEWQYGTMPGEQGCLVAVDGPLRQPFSNYMENSEANAQYMMHGLQHAALHSVPPPSRMTFDDTSKAYTRLEAMKVAKEQAIIREKAAEYVQRGKTPPTDLRQQYEKTLSKKLNHSSQQRSSNRARAPEAMMQGSPTYMPGLPASAMAPPGPSGYPAVGQYMQGMAPMPGMMQSPAAPNLFGSPNLYADMNHRMPLAAHGPPIFDFTRH